MARKYTFEEVQKKYVNSNMLLLASEYKDNKTLMKTKCMTCGHEWLTSLNGVLRKKGCPKCSGKYCMNLAEVKNWCLKNNIVYVDDYYRNNREFHRFKCLKDNYDWVTSFGPIKNGYSKCPKCSNRASLSLAEVKEFCLKNGLLFLSDTYKGARIKYNFQCLRCDYNQLSSFNNIKNGGRIGCPKCSNYTISKMETKWLDSLNVPNNCRQKTIKLNNKKFLVDGYVIQTNTIYEFFGDYWHGNPKKFKSNDINQHCKKTYGELYEETMKRIKLFQNFGYTIVYIWENEWVKNENCSNV